jgi:hypothetical protein
MDRRVLTSPLSVLQAKGPWVAQCTTALERESAKNKSRQRMGVSVKVIPNDAERAATLVKETPDLFKDERSKLAEDDKIAEVQEQVRLRAVAPFEFGIVEPAAARVIEVPKGRDTDSANRTGAAGELLASVLTQYARARPSTARKRLVYAMGAPGMNQGRPAGQAGCLAAL